jgi:hypothetical protein
MANFLSFGDFGQSINWQIHQRLTRTGTCRGARRGIALAASSPTRFKSAINEAVIKYSFKSASRRSPWRLMRVVFMISGRVEPSDFQEPWPDYSGLSSEIQGRKSNSRGESPANNSGPFPRFGKSE